MLWRSLLFYLSAGELCAFFQLFVFQPSVGNLMGEAFYWLSFGLFRKNGNHLLWQCLSLCMKRLCHICDCFISTARWKYSLFLLLSHRRNPRLRHFAGCSFGTSRNKQQPFSINTSHSPFRWFSKNSFWISHSWNTSFIAKMNISMTQPKKKESVLGCRPRARLAKGIR